MSGTDYVSFILNENDEIKNFIAEISTQMYDYIQSKMTSRFVLFYKYLTHADLATFGKSTKPNTLEKNLLYYIDEEEMTKIEHQTKRPFPTTHQSCIGLKQELYNLVGLPQPREADPYLINDYMNVYLVNHNMHYFTSKYTRKVFSKLNKEIPKGAENNWVFDKLDVALSSEEFTSIPLHCAVHGLGMAQDEEFHKLRHHMFEGDTFILLFKQYKKLSNDVNRLIPLATQLENVRIEMMQHYGRA